MVNTHVVNYQFAFINLSTTIRKKTLPFPSIHLHHLLKPFSQTIRFYRFSTFRLKVFLSNFSSFKQNKCLNVEIQDAAIWTKNNKIKKKKKEKSTYKILWYALNNFLDSEASSSASWKMKGFTKEDNVGVSCMIFMKLPPIKVVQALQTSTKTFFLKPLSFLRRERMPKCLLQLMKIYEAGGDGRTKALETCRSEK